MSALKIGFAGMTHLGLVSASAVAAKGFMTVCYDPDDLLIRRLARDELHVVEPDLDQLVRSNEKTQRFTSDITALRDCDVVYISPDVPTDDDGNSDLSGIRGLAEQVAANLKEDSIFVILCQVPPGFTRSLKAPVEERRYYQVETLVFGRAVERAMRPERYIVGCANPSQPIPPQLAEILRKFECPLLPMRYESAELAKISINMCLVASISVANALAELCEAIGADWSEIVPALKLDARIGAHAYLAPGLGIAGGNLERDLVTVQTLASKHGTDAGIVRAWRTNSSHRREWAASVLHRVLLDIQPAARVAVWGLAYKQDTHSVKNSPSLATIALLHSAELRLHDPVVRGEQYAPPNAKVAANPLDAAQMADALAILTPWSVYRGVLPSDIAKVMRGRIVIDPYRVLDPAECARVGLDYYTLGMPPVISALSGAARC